MAGTRSDASGGGVKAKRDPETVRPTVAGLAPIETEDVLNSCESSYTDLGGALVASRRDRTADHAIGRGRRLWRDRTDSSLQIGGPSGQVRLELVGRE
jgi:hypothetical protein